MRRVIQLCGVAEKRRKLNCGKKIAEALSMSSMLLVTEMALGGGIMANAILSRFPMRRVNALKHKSQFFRYGGDNAKEKVVVRFLVSDAVAQL